MLERRSGEIVGIEIKAAASVSASDSRGLRALKEMAGARFRRGVVLYSGAARVPFGEDLDALPIGWLWRGSQ